jgi:hypothetical protein
MMEFNITEKETVEFDAESAICNSGIFVCVWVAKPSANHKSLLSYWLALPRDVAAEYVDNVKVQWLQELLTTPKNSQKLSTATIVTIPGCEQVSWFGFGHSPSFSLSFSVISLVSGRSSSARGRCVLLHSGCATSIRSSERCWERSPHNRRSATLDSGALTASLSYG